MVLVPEVIQAIKKIRDVPVLAAGGIVTGRQMAAAMAMGADGAWTGSVWLATTESETSEIFREKMIEATRRDAVRLKSRTAASRSQLLHRLPGPRACGTQAQPPTGALPMPLMTLVSENALRSAGKGRHANGNAKRARHGHLLRRPGRRP